MSSNYKPPDGQTITYVRLPDDLRIRLDALTKKLDEEAQAANKGPGKIRVKKTNVIEAAVRQYVEQEEAKRRN